MNHPARGPAAETSRRRFLRGAAGIALFSTAGCERLEEIFMLGPSEGPTVPPDGKDIDLVTHTINRLSFGPTPSEYTRVSSLGKTQELAVKAYIAEQLAPEAIDDRRAERAVRRFEPIHEPLGELFEYKEEFLLEQLTRATLVRATRSKRQLFEVMAHFWSDHFNIDISKAECRWLKAADDREVVRKHALGKFPDLVRASALSPAMLWYLDGRENRKRDAGEKPNENYARELLELHTLGVDGGYTQNDVMEVARCLSGWTVRSMNRIFKGSVEFHSDAHDNGTKSVLGEQISSGGGKKDLDSVLRILCAHPSTAMFIATKLCRRFIADDPPDAAVQATAASFTSSKGDIRKTLRSLCATSAFLENHRGTKLKRPFEFMVSALRASRARVRSELAIVDYLLRMGHAPFQYPTPDGYADVASPWTGTLLWRWHFAIALARNAIDDDITVDEKKLTSDLGGRAGLAAHLLGRKPSDEEKAGVERSGEPLALLLASPAFQWR